MFFSPISDKTDRFLFGALGALTDSMDGFFGTIKRLAVGRYVVSYRMAAAVLFPSVFLELPEAWQRICLLVPLMLLCIGLGRLGMSGERHPVNLLVFGLLYVAGGNSNRMAKFLQHVRA